MLSILYGLLSGLAWGASDFFGGLSSRRASAYQAVLFGEIVGLFLLLVAAIVLGEPPMAWTNWLYTASAGGMGVFALLLFYMCLAKGRMSLAAPVSALASVVIPVVVSAFLEGLPGWLTYVGFLVAMLAIWLVSAKPDDRQGGYLNWADLRLPLLAGACFGLYLVFFREGSKENIIWPMIASRAAGTTTMGLFMAFKREPFLPGRSIWHLIVLISLCDITGNALYILAGQVGRLDIAAVLVSLYPGSTVLLAWLLLKERITRPQWIGILLALTAIVLITI